MSRVRRLMGLLAGAGLLGAGPASGDAAPGDAPSEAPLEAPSPEAPAGAARVEAPGTGSLKRFGVSLDRKKPLEIRSDEFEAIRDGEAKHFIFRRNVQVLQADVVIRAGRLDAYYPPQALDPDRLEATGDVVVTQGDREVRCERATYHRDSDRLVCSGSAELRDGADRISGDVIEFDLARETVVVTGGARLTLQPRPERPQQEPPG